MRAQWDVEQHHPRISSRLRGGLSLKSILRRKMIKLGIGAL
jgi:hypothetical protein